MIVGHDIKIRFRTGNRAAFYHTLKHRVNAELALGHANRFANWRLGPKAWCMRQSQAALMRLFCGNHSRVGADCSQRRHIPWRSCSSPSMWPTMRRTIRCRVRFGLTGRSSGQSSACWEQTHICGDCAM